MKYFLRPIIGNILLVIESILLFFITSMFILKITVFNEKYVTKKIDNNYYEATYNEMIDTMSYIARKSNLKEDILCIISFSFFPLNGVYPHNKIYKITPRDHTSHFSV